MRNGIPFREKKARLLSYYRAPRFQAEKIGDQRTRYRELCRECEALAEERDKAIETALQAEVH